MRLLVLSPSLDRPGGVARSVQRLTRSLRARGHAIVLVAPDHDLFPGDVRREGQDVRFGPRARGTSAAAVAEHAQIAAGAVTPEGGAEAVLGFYATTGGRAAVSTAAHLGLASVIAARGNDVDRDLEGVGEAAGATREALRRATAVTAVSTEMVHKLRASVGCEATFVTNAVDTEVFRPDPGGASAFARRHELLPGRKVLGVFGELKEKRGLAMLRALPAEALAPFEILVVGAVRPEVRQDLPEGARWIPYLHDDDTLRGAYGACDAILQPSVRDGMPNVVLEAMACGRTVVASRAGGLADLVAHGETGLTCETEAQWSAALAAVARGETTHLGEAARARVPTLAAEAAAFEDVLQRAIRRYTASSASR